jgi:hypothetical protein
MQSRALDDAGATKRLSVEVLTASLTQLTQINDLT